jgi:hypothetical protein
MFTGVIDQEGEETVRELGGELVDSVYHCTHLVTDKVRRTVKFLCCLSRGCHIVNDQWLGACGMEGRFVATETYLVKDRTAERQHKFSLSKSLEMARHSKLLSGHRVFLSPSIKPAPKDMADIIRCGGGEVLTTLPDPPGVGVLIVASKDDLSMLSAAVEAGVAVHTPELILSGVLRQELDLDSHLLPVGGASTSGPTPSSSAMATAGEWRRKRKTASNTDTVPTAKRRRK